MLSTYNKYPPVHPQDPRQQANTRRELSPKSRPNLSPNCHPNPTQAPPRNPGPDRGRPHHEMSTQPEPEYCSSALPTAPGTRVFCGVLPGCNSAPPPQDTRPVSPRPPRPPNPTLHPDIGPEPQIRAPGPLPGSSRSLGLRSPTPAPPEPQTRPISARIRAHPTPPNSTRIPDPSPRPAPQAPPRPAPGAAAATKGRISSGRDLSGAPRPTPLRACAGRACRRDLCGPRRRRRARRRGGVRALTSRCCSRRGCAD